MGTILNHQINKKFYQSLRWKLVSTYLILIVFTFVLTLRIVEDSLTTSSIEKLETEILTQANIIADQVESYFENYTNLNTYEFIRDMVNQQSTNIDSRVIVTDNNGVVVIDSYGQYSDNSLIHIKEISNALEGESSVRVYTYGEDSIVYAAVPMISNSEVLGCVFLSRNANEVFWEVKNTINTLTIVFLFSSALSVIVGVLFASFLSGPIENMNETVKTITKGNYDVKLEISRNDEIGELAKSFNAMITKLDQVDDSRKKFVSNVSHELRTPMTSMKIVCDTLLEQPSWDEAVYRDFLADINSEVTRLNKIIDSLLYLSKIEKKELTLEYSMSYVNFLIDQAVKTLNPIAHKKNIELIFVTEEKVQIELDKEKMLQCIINIVGNAIKYTPENGLVKVDLYSEKETVSISVTDTGVGIPQKDLEFIFDRFYRVDEARHRKTGGTGLGLSIAQQVVHLHQGRILVKSEVGAGTMITVELPNNSRMV